MTDEIHYLTGDIQQDTQSIFQSFSNSFDVKSRFVKILEQDAVFLYLDGMISEIKASISVINPLTQASVPKKHTDIMQYIRRNIYAGTDIKSVASTNEVCSQIISGCLVLLLNNQTSGFSFGVQGFCKKGIEEPQTEQNERGSQESFNDSFKDNVTLLRRRLKTPDLVIERLSIGQTSQTPTLLCYVKGKADQRTIKKVQHILQNARFDTLLGSAYLRPFLDKRRFSFFSGSGFTERPDMLAAKLCEGRIGILVDGTPFALIVPYLFADYFHSLDDYLFKPYYALFMRLLRMLCFFIAVTLPGFFTAVCVFHPEALPGTVIADIAKTQASTPFDVTAETITIHLIYEIVREAGLRMPRAIGHAVSIVGALVIGDTAVTAGLIGAPMLIVVALTAICSSVVSKLHETTSVLRFLFIIAGGYTGLFGVFLGLGMLLADMCNIETFGVPFSAPFSPFSLRQQADNVFRADWKKLGKTDLNVRGMKKI